MYLQKEIEKLIDIAINEDIGSGDITTDTLVPKSAMASGTIVMKQAGVTAALPFLEMLFQKLDPEVSVKLLVPEGSYQKAGTIIAKVLGPARAILAGERVALNLLQHAFAVATVTSEYVKKVKGLPCQILDTRKTLPGLRALEKYGVRVGGGVNHRFSLEDRLIIKRNHLYFQQDTSQQALAHAIEKAYREHPERPIEVEIWSRLQLPQALSSEAQAIMLSHMMPSEIKKCVQEIRKTNKKVYIESLGTITLDTVRAYAETGVDGISIGSITCLDRSLIDIVMKLK